MLNFLSSVLGLGNKIDDLGVFDPLMDIDSNYFINIKRLKETNIPEFKESYSKINKRFKEIGILLANSKISSDRLYQRALQLFDFPEVNGIGLGYSNNEHGSGFGPKLRKQIIKDAKQIIDSGVKEPEIFHLVGLFERNVGPDRISDMIACIIEDDIIAYTKRINKELSINSSKYSKFEFVNELLINPYKKSPLLLLPKEVLHEIPIARDWDDIDKVCNEINNIRLEINEVIGNKWSKMSIGYKKDFLRDFFISNPSHLMETITKYRSASVKPYDFKKDAKGEHIVAKIANNLPKNYPIQIQQQSTTFETYQIAQVICNKFKDLIENNKVSELLYYGGKPRPEKIVQRAFFCVADSYCNAFNIGISPETDSGRGPVDFKFERSYEDRTIVEIKLTSSSSQIHGIETQIQEYGKAEKTSKMIYLAVHNGGPQKRIDDLKSFYLSNKAKKGCPELIIVDATPKDSASKYKST
ncbi:hypothetical protein M5E03_18655 [Bacillus safensis]|uniref:hypothetical protein n=1 Tax=Bacillus safensis TaxID=561879 RepID=UPI002075E9E7|nr:hypothetical protein [Bacillus safensis]USD79105.1 hypothetical protein M5E03_18655 [Bacillus safensis]